jgi:hypothetical protein
MVHRTDLAPWGAQYQVSIPFFLHAHYLQLEHSFRDIQVPSFHPSIALVWMFVFHVPQQLR